MNRDPPFGRSSSFEVMSADEAHGEVIDAPVADTTNRSLECDFDHTPPPIRGPLARSATCTASDGLHTLELDVGKVKCDTDQRSTTASVQAVQAIPEDLGLAY